MIRRRTKKPSMPKGEAPLSYYLHHAMAGRRNGRSWERIHASSVTKDDYCPRFAALAERDGVEPETEIVSASQRLVWFQGEALAREVIRWAVRAGVGAGDWMCKYCRALHTLMLRPEECRTCSNKEFSFQEPRVVSQLSGISCGLDLIYAPPNSNQLMEIVELKTIGKAEFQKLTMPLAEHRDRTRLYLRSLHESDNPSKHLVRSDTARILYVSKGGWGDKSSLPFEWGVKDDGGWTPFKEFQISRDDVSVQSFVDLAAPLWKWKQDRKTLPPRVCASKIATRAQKCKLASVCFGEKD